MSQQTLERKCWVIYRGDGPPLAVFNAKGADVYREAGMKVEGPFVATEKAERDD